MDLLDEMIEDVRELDAYTPDYFSEKWDHPGIVNRTEERLRALFAVAYAAREWCGGDESLLPRRVARALAALDALPREQ